jgi:hypothetical protein
MHSKPRGFIDNHQVFVIVNDAAIYPLRPTIGNTRVFFAGCHRDWGHPNNVTHMQFALRLYTSLVHANFTCPDGFVYSRLGYAVQNPHQVIIQTLTGLLIGQLNELNS